jgi:hypothetical protein
MIERLQANPDILRFHVHYRCERAAGPLPARKTRGRTRLIRFAGTDDLS